MATSTRPLTEIYHDLSLRIIIENIKKYIEAYDDEWIAIHEALQNAIDAIQRSERAKGNVTVELWIDQEAVRITDNGRGFPPNLDLLCPGLTDKGDSGVTKGYQGVGLKALMHSSSKLNICGTFEPQSRWKFEAVDLYKLLEEDETIPHFSETTNSLDVEHETGTVISYTFPRSLVSTFVRELFDEHYSEDGRWHDLYKH